ncbi:MAG TPA: glycosyltransferase family 87 protein [Rhizomicrobium sp.]|jgi:arabinofuranan 3-O-arabinosyltransferase|nr:glycosyltransferase family 87 protein [Rhizomicrobium sp.]
MTAPRAGPARPVAPGRAHPVAIAVSTLALMFAGGMALAYPAYLGLMFRSHAWILVSNGRPAITDFLVFWLAGASALRGAAAAAYDPHLLHVAEVAAAGHEFSHHLPWRYSPLFLFVAAALALLPYVTAFLVWVGATLAVFSLAIFRIAGSRLGLVLACATPAVFINAICGQNGPLTAALIGAVLWCLERKSVLTGGATLSLKESWLPAGILLALLTYKPQFGVLFPLVLVAGGYWRTLICAAVATAAGILLCWAAFGAGTLYAFVHFLPITSNDLLVHGQNGFNNLQTVYGLVRWSGFGNLAGWVAQGAVICATATALLWLWRRPVPFALKAAAFATATLLATPHLYIYDFAILIVSFAFLYHQRAFDMLEVAAIAVANFLIGAFLFFPTPIGLVAVAIAVAMIARRVIQEEGAPRAVTHFAQFSTPQFS